MSSLYLSYQQDYILAEKQFLTSLDVYNKIGNNYNMKDKEIQKMRKYISNMYNAAKNMQAQFIANSAKLKGQQPKIKKYQQNLSEYKKNFQQVLLFRERTETDKEDIILQKKYKNLQRIKQMDKKFYSINQNINQTSQQLNRQKEILKNSQEKLINTNQELNRVDRILRSIRNKELVGKILLISLVVFIAIADIILFYIKIL